MSGHALPARHPRPRLTLFTPTYQSAGLVHRVWESVQTQTSHDFEWLVVDDGSTDGTVAWLRAREADCIVPMRIVTKPRNEGLLSSYRIAVREARAPLLLPLGHDDAFVPHAVATFLRHWDAIPASEQDRYAGVTARCMHADGQPIDEPLGAPWVDATPAEMYFLHGRRKEKWGFTRTALVERHLPPDVDAFVPEGAIWRSIGVTHPTRYVDDVLRIYHRDNPGSMMNDRTRIRSPRGRAYAQVLRLNLEWQYRRHDPAHFRASMVTYARYALDAGLTPVQAARHLEDAAARRLFWLTLPQAALASLNDRRKRALEPDRVRGDWARGTGRDGAGRTG